MVSHVLDLYTLAVILILISAALGVAMLVTWRANKTYAGFGWWTAGNLVGSSGIVFLGFRGLMPDVITIIVANLLSVAGLLVALHGIRVFLGRRGRIHFNITILALHLVTSVYFLVIDNNMVMRIVAVSLVTAAISAVSGYEFLAVHKAARRFIHLFAASVFFGFAVLVTARAITTFTLSPVQDLFAPNWIQSLTFVLFNLFAVMWTFTYILLNSQRLQEELETTQVELERLATTDYLTGLSNTRAFFDRAAVEINRSQRHGIPLSVVVFDIDHFKKVNDTFGHPGGDRMLKELAAACGAMTRQNDMLSRLGGEEFGLLLTHTDLNGAAFVAENFRKAVEELVVEHDAETIFVTLSFGVTELSEDDTLESFMARADRCLYQAKDRGRNCVVIESGDGAATSYLESVNMIPPAHSPVQSDRHV